MRDAFAGVLHRLPPPARSAVATLGSLYSRRRRILADRAAGAAAALERDAWTAEQWRAWRDEHLAELLQRAATRVPYYRAYWERRRRVGDRTAWDRLENWPVLEPDELRASAARLVADDADTRRMMRAHAWGACGRPLTVWRSRRTIAAFEALTEARLSRWHDIPPDAAWARITARLVTPAARRRPPFWLWNGALRQLTMSAYHLAPDLIPRYLDALVEYRVGVIVARPAALDALAQEAARLGRSDVRLVAAVTTGRPVPTEQRRRIEAAFGCTVVDGWGMTEMAAHAGRCPEGALHLWPEVGVVEVLGADGEPVAPGESGDLVCTGLLNTDMPLIRYRSGDRGRLAPEGASCACGRALPLVTAVEPRAAEMLLTRDGRQVTSLTPVFDGLPVRETQIVQEAADRILVRVAPGVGYGAGTSRAIVARLVSRLGDMDIRLATVAAVPRAADGRVQPVVCQLSPAERAAVLRRARGEPEGDA